MKVEWSQPNIGQEEKNAVMRVMDSGWLSQGPETKAFERELGAIVGNQNCVAVNNGTSALITALLAHDVKPGDEVIVPAHTFMASINSILAVGAVPVLVDCDEKTWNTTPELVKAKITKKTKAIMPVDVAGMPVDIFGFQELAEDYKLKLIIDSAESFGAEYRGRMVGDIHFEHTTVFSFHIAKQVTTIEGGCIFTNNSEIYHKCKSIRDHGMQGRYNYTMFGLNFRITDLQSAIGRVQLSKLGKALTHRARCVALYKKCIGNKFLYQEKPEYVTRHANLFFGIRAPKRGNLLNKLEEKNVGTRICWPYTMDQPFHGKILSGKFPVSKRISQDILALPLSNNIPFEHIKYVCDIINGEV